MARSRENFIVEQQTQRFKRHAAMLQLPLVDLDLPGLQRAYGAHESASRKGKYSPHRCNA